MKPLLALVFLAVFLMGCQSPAAPAAEDGIERPAAVFDGGLTPPDMAATATPTPAATVAPAPTAAPTFPADKIPWPEDGFTDAAQYLAWLQALPATVVCTDELDSGNLTCFSQTEDWQIVTEELIKSFPGMRLAIDLATPATFDTGRTEIMHCYPPNPNSPAGSCQISDTYGTITFRPRAAE